jgi:predicted RNase H-like HicB family nuclease
MELEGKVWKDGKFWLVEVPAIDVCTQGRTRKEALMMIEDAIMELMSEYFQAVEIKDIKLEILDHEKNIFGVKASNNNLMLSFSLIRQRELSKSTVREVAERLGSKSPNAYAQYERGKMRITLDQYERLLQAANPERPPILRVV